MAEVKRILVVSQHFWPESFRISDIVSGFVESGIEVDVLCGIPNYPQGEWFEGYSYRAPRRQQYEGAEIFRAGEIRRKGNTGIRIFLNYVSFPVISLFTLPKLRGRRYDAVFCYETSPVMMMLPAIIAARRNKVPLTTYVLDLWPDNLYSVLPIKNKLLRAVAQGVSNWFYRRSDRLIAMSEKLSHRLLDVTSGKGRNPEIFVIPQYCEDFYAQKTSCPEVESAFLGKAENGKPFFNILFAGNLSPAQDLENLIAAMQIVHSKKEIQVRVVIVGDGMSLEPLKNIVAQQNLESSIIFCGRQPAEDIPKWTTAADVLFAGLLKSDNLGLTVPAKITSYFAAGKPILVAADGEARRAAEESGAALISPAGDSQALADNIIRLATMEKPELDKMGLAGTQSYTTHYKRDRLLKQLENVILKGSLE